MPTPPISIPRELLPRDGRFGSGPSLVRPAAVEALASAATGYLGTSHRKAPVKLVVADVRAGLRELYGLPNGYEVALGIGGATLFWDAAVFGLIESRSQHLVCGEFSAKFAAVAANAPHLLDPVVREAPPGSAPTVDDGADDDTLALIHNETSTGVMMPVRRPAGGERLVVVDATSAAGAAPVDPLDFDAYYFSPQKAFASEGGLWLALLSPAAVERISRLREARWAPPTLDLAVAVENAAKDQTYNTPALATLFLLREQIRWMLDNGGLEWTSGRSTRSARHIYAWAERSEYAAPFVTDPALRSTTTVTVDVTDDIPVAEIGGVLRDHGVVDIEGYRKLGRNQLRIATFPSIDPEDVARLTACIDFVVAHR